MKILFVQPFFTFFDVFLSMLPGNLDKKGHDVEVVSFFRDKKGTQLYLKETNIRFHFLDAFSISIPNLVKEFPYFISLVKVIEEIQPDIMHINNLPFLTTLQSTRLAKKMGIPSIVHVHGVMAKSNKLIDLAQSLYIRTLGQQIFNDATLVICLTRSDAYEIQRYMCPAEKIRIVPNGVDVETFKPYSSVMDNLLFWGGRFVFQKGLIYLIHAFANVVNSNPDIKLRMTGDGPLLSKIYAMVKSYGLENNVEFKGRVPRDELSKLIGESSIYLLPSLKEGMPYALLEAMACGKPVIGSDIPGINDVITHGKNGILVPPRNPEALANAILTILDDKGLRIKLGQNARQLMVEKYSWDTISEKIEKIYHEAIEERK